MSVSTYPCGSWFGPCALTFLMIGMAVMPAMSQAQTVTALKAPKAPSVATPTDLVGPLGSERFGMAVTALPNGNIVVTDPNFSIGGPSVGAAYLYNGATGALISTLTGSNAFDLIGFYGVAVLSNGNYVISSANWNGGRGAVTWGSATTGVSGVVSAANSLVGSSTVEAVGTFSVTPLTNGNYVVRTPGWQNGATPFAGAVTWGNGATGTSGTISAANSLVGSQLFDDVGSHAITALTNGNYVVNSPFWKSGTFSNVGAVTWANGFTGTSGVVSAANSLVGGTDFADIGTGGITALTNGNYVVNSLAWNGSRGAVTWGNGATGISGVVSAANSLVGSTSNDLVGSNGVTALPNGNYVVNSPSWNDGLTIYVGAATWGNGATGISGPVSAANSLVGSTPFDRIASGITRALSNGNYVVSTPTWSNGLISNVGAATWGNGASGTSGVVSAANSLIGSVAFEQVSNEGVTALTNGNYVVRSANWNGARGAATWGNGATGISGPVSAANSLVGSTPLDQIGVTGVTVLANGNYVVSSQFWDNGGAVDAGAATWGNGASGTTGSVSAANSLVGSANLDRVAISGVVALTNGNYIVSSPAWNGLRGAATWGSGTAGISGPVSAANSLVGSTAGDEVSFNGVTALTNGNYVIRSQFWDNGVITDAGAVTWGNGATGSSGPISPFNSLVGSTASDLLGNGSVKALANGTYITYNAFWDNGGIVDAGAVTFGTNGSTVGSITAANSVLGTRANVGVYLVFDYDYVNRQMVVGRPDSNIVTLFPASEFDLCAQDETNSTISLAFNSQTGAYLFCAAGTPYSGVGKVIQRGSTYTLQHAANDRRLQASFDTTTNRASASFQKLGASSGVYNLIDRDIRNSTCSCAAP
ncbi:MAG: hypothetical protein ACJ74J_22155 [Blastocatellia bacterium]